MTVFVGFASSAAALSLALAFLARVALRPVRGGLGGWLAPLLASPHSAIAIGLAFLIAPSGWLVRLLSPWATGFTTPPDVAIVGDPFGLALTLGLAVKETPFLIAVGLAALRQFPAQAELRAARALGYAPATAFLVIVAPQLYARMRTPVYAVLAYGLSVVDMAIVLAPSHPAPLSVLGLGWLLSPNLDDVFVGNAAAALQLGVVAASLVVWRGSETLLRRALVTRARSGARSGLIEPAARGLSLAAGVLVGLGLAALVVLALWAFAWRWPYPRAWPESFTLDIVRRAAPQLIGPLGTTVALAFLTTAAALALAVGCLESDASLGRHWTNAAFYLPLLLPQLSFLFGVETLFSALRLDGSFLAVAWAHLLFVFPYVLLALAGPWAEFDPRYARAARALGAGGFKTSRSRQAADSRRPPGARLRDRSFGLRGAVSFDAVCRRRTGRDADDRGARAHERRRPQAFGHCRAWAGALSSRGLRRRAGHAATASPAPPGPRRSMSGGGLFVDRATISVGERRLVDGLTLRVAPAQAATVMGPSGAGKSALLSFIGGHIDRAFAARGRVFVDGGEVSHLPPERRGIGLLFQDDLLFPHLSVGANVAFGLDPSVAGRAARTAEVADALAEAGLAGFADRDPATLSGGQRARVALMRSLVAAPRALLLDEPFGKLDRNLRRDLRRFVLDAAVRRRLPILLVTHDPEDAEAAGGPVYRLDALKDSQ